MLVHMIGVKDKDYFPVIVVANKCDLEYERQVGGHGEFFCPLLALLTRPLSSALRYIIISSFHSAPEPALMF